MSPRPLAALAGAAWLAAGAAGAADLDLARSVELALAQNPALAAVAERRNEVAGGVREVRADAYPQLSLVGGWNRARSPSLLNSKDFEEFLQNFPGGRFEPQASELWGGGLELSQPLYTFGKVRAAIALAELVVEETERQIDTARLDTALAAAEAHFGVIAARDGLAAIEIQREARREALAVVMSAFEIEEATELDRLRAEAAFAEVEPEVARRRGQVAVAEGRLRQMLGLPADEPLELAPIDRALGEAPGYAELLEVAKGRRPELAELAVRSQVLDKRTVVTRASGKPQVELNGFYGREVRLPENFDDPLYANWRVSVDLKWELFDGFRRRGQLAQIESQRSQLDLLLADLESRIAVEVREGLTAYRTALARAEAARAAASAAGEASRVARANFEEGVALLSDLLDAQRRETEAEVLEVDAVYEARLISVRLARAVGHLPTEAWSSEPTVPQPPTEN
ncbi:MAG TPA: TolC family protein [Thermoanaerobaculia bacterium]|nr:TolC family protein [Thermoanaerobaculia bacterium]